MLYTACRLHGVHGYLVFSTTTAEESGLNNTMPMLLDSRPGQSHKGDPQDAPLEARVSHLCQEPDHLQPNVL